VAYYEQSLPRNAPPKAAHPLAIALGRLGSAYRNLMEFDSAAEAYRRSAELEAKILTVDPADMRSRIVDASRHEDLGVLADSDRYPSRGKPDEAIAEWSEAVRLFSVLAEADRNDMRAQTMAASAGANLALVRLRRNAAGDVAAADQLSERALATLDAGLRKAPKSGFLRSRLPLIGYVRGLALARKGACAEGLAQSQRALDAERAFVKESHFTADNRLDLAGQLLRHAQVAVTCGDSAGAAAASREAGELFNGLAPEIQRWMGYAYQAGAYRFALAQAQEAKGLGADAAANYAEAAGYWSQWQQGRPYMQKRVAEANAARGDAPHRHESLAQPH
jgi:tetratricopeptide (TPR) repeat protein